MNYINIEVGKMLRSKRITEETLSELDSRIAIEVYLREKKFAILEDRLNEAVNDESGASPLAAQQEESKLHQIQQTLPAIVKQVDD